MRLGQDGEDWGPRLSTPPPPGGLPCPGLRLQARSLLRPLVAEAVRCQRRLPPAQVLPGAGALPRFSERPRLFLFLVAALSQEGRMSLVRAMGRGGSFPSPHCSQQTRVSRERPRARPAHLATGRRALCSHACAVRTRSPSSLHTGPLFHILVFCRWKYILQKFSFLKGIFPFKYLSLSIAV